MENGSFQPQLKSYDFGLDAESNEQDEKFSALDSKGHYSPSLEALFRQNEDLSARLKVTLQRLSQFETSLSEEIEKNQQTSKANASLQDQILIWKEKERLWLEKLEKSKQRIDELGLQIPKYAQLQNEVQRYKKYHEKVKTQIKPYLQQLKEYSNSLVGEIRELHHELSSQEHELNKKLNRILELENELKNQASSHLASLEEKENELKIQSAIHQGIIEKKDADLQILTALHQAALEKKEGEIKIQISAHLSATQELQTMHNAEIKSLQSEIQTMKQTHIALEMRSQRLDQALARQDELGNLVVVLNRKVEEAQVKLETETEGLRQSLLMARNDLLKRNTQIEESEIQKAKMKDDGLRTQREIMALNEQLSSIRYQWKENSDENKKLKGQIATLEKINQELSMKLAAFIKVLPQDPVKGSGSLKL
jgi:chromosome segregation ATPase